MRTACLGILVAFAMLTGCGSSEATAVLPTGKAVTGDRPVDDFGLPLIIQIDAPQPPKEILGPFPMPKNEKLADAKPSKSG